jgi:hypothetical protein
MASASYQQVLRVAESLSREEQLRLIQELADHAANAEGTTTSVMELCGLGQEIWQHRDAQEYVNSERASWNG